MIYKKSDVEDLISRKISKLSKKYGSDVRDGINEILILHEKLYPTIKETRLIPVTAWNKYYDYPSISGLRMKIHRSQENGFDDYNVVHREGRRVLIDEQAYLRWLNRDKEL